MNREQKAAVIEEIAVKIQQSEAIFAVDFRGITVPQAAELRDKLRAVDASFKVVKNSLTERAADQVGAEHLKPFLAGPTALTFVGGDAATAAKTVADYARITVDKLAFKGGVMDGAPLTADQVTAISKLPPRDVLYGQLVGLVASPLTGLVRTLNALIGGLAVALGGVLEKKESGEIPAGPPPAQAAAEPVVAASVQAPAPVDSAPTDEPEPQAQAASVEDAAPADPELASVADAAPADPEPVSVADAAPADPEPVSVADAAPADPEPASVADAAPAEPEPDPEPQAEAASVEDAAPADPQPESEQEPEAAVVPVEDAAPAEPEPEPEAAVAPVDEAAPAEQPEPATAAPPQDAAPDENEVSGEAPAAETSSIDKENN
jgi:large subunit ribosomal protein L10